LSVEAAISAITSVGIAISDVFVTVVEGVEYFVVKTAERIVDISISAA